MPATLSGAWGIRWRRRWRPLAAGPSPAARWQDDVYSGAERLDPFCPGEIKRQEIDQRCRQTWFWRYDRCHSAARSGAATPVYYIRLRLGAGFDGLWGALPP